MGTEFCNIKSRRSKVRFVCGITLLAVCLLFCGCASSQVDAWQEYKVFCGMSSQSGEVSEKAWEDFCNKHVSAAFPDGYTVIDATGYWRSASAGTEKERSKIILILAPADARSKVLSVADQYRRQFAQEVVLISTSEVKTDFVQ